MFLGSAQEFVEKRILGCFLKNDEFGFGEGCALGLGQQVAEILEAAAPPGKSLHVAVDGFQRCEAYFAAAVVQDPVQVIQQLGRPYKKSKSEQNLVEIKEGLDCRTPATTVTS
jgi:hypothetical protein